jgi:hypothetical protein
MSRVQKNILKMKEEIDRYRVPRAIKKAMLNLAKLGYEFSGHGIGMGSEDWSVLKDISKYNDYIHVSFAWNGRKCTSQYEMHLSDKIIYSPNVSRPADVVKIVSKIKSRQDLLRKIYLNESKILSKKTKKRKTVDRLHS